MSDIGASNPETNEQKLVRLEVALKELEVSLKTLEIRDREREARRFRINWTVAGPLMAAIVAGIIGYGTSWFNAANQLSLEKLKAKNSLVIEAVKTGTADPSLADNNLTFFLDAGLIEDDSGVIRRLVEERRGPVLPSITLPPALLATCSLDVAAMNFSDLLNALEGETVSAADIANVRERVLKAVPAPLNDNQRDALASLLYNVGQTTFESSPVVALVKAGDMAGAANAFLSVGRSNFAILIGLRYNERRACERDYFLKPPA